jgi:hypothetical protein
MSLTITTRIVTKQGISVEDAYGRVAVQDFFAGEELQSAVNFYTSEDAYLQGVQSLPTDLTTNARNAYDRAVDGTDILDLAHDNIIAVLAEQNVTAIKNL